MDLFSAKAAFLGDIKDKALVPRYAHVLDELIRWSELQSQQLQFFWKLDPRRQNRVSFYLPPCDGSPFWDAYPDQEAKLYLLVDEGGFDESLRGEARMELAAIDERIPKENERPFVSFATLLRPKMMAKVQGLMSRLLDQVTCSA